jgi:hypothetical protein
MDNDDNFESQEEDAKRVDYKEEDTMRSNESGDIKNHQKNPNQTMKQGHQGA